MAAQIENETFWKGLFNTFENDTGWIWKQLCACSNTVFDIGANTGIYSMVAKTINPSVKVHAFEPSVHTFKKLQLNCDLNKFDIKCEQIALSNKECKQLFYDTYYTHQTSASLSPDKLKNWSGFEGETFEYEVETTTISSYVETHHIEQIDLIKIDIEMHEPEAIEGFGEYLERFKPIVLIEVLSEEVAEKLNQLINIDDHLIFHLEEEGKAEKKDEFSVFPGKWNFLFFHKENINKVKQHTTLMQ
jgi:FkbM family methyltransferase